MRQGVQAFSLPAPGQKRPPANPTECGRSLRVWAHRTSTAVSRRSPAFAATSAPLLDPRCRATANNDQLRLPPGSRARRRKAQPAKPRKPAPPECAGRTEGARTSSASRSLTTCVRTSWLSSSSCASASALASWHDAPCTTTVAPSSSINASHAPSLFGHVDRHRDALMPAALRDRDTGIAAGQ